MKKISMKKHEEVVSEFGLPSEDVKAIVGIHAAMGVSVECAVELMLVAERAAAVTAETSASG